ncbi:diacylglycerol kinase family protein (plasmid) [Tistrella bauzanensis]|uniref:Diacylglycerol kinase family protein n=1 Tax=Tistrella arctica TaxID=3133430 RepID=A0ABU9YNQ2_9PROT
MRTGTETVRLGAAMDGGGRLPRPPRLLVIANPLAGTGSGRRLLTATLELLRANGCQLLIAEARTPEEIGAIAGGTGPEDADIVVAAGGDGTINAAANGLIAAASPLPLGVLAVGTANVLALEMGLTRHPQSLAEPILHGQVRPVTPIAAAGGHALLMVGVGFDAAVVAALADRPQMKWRLGKLAYLQPTLTQAFRYRFPPIDLLIDGQPARAVAAIAVNGRFYGGAFRAVPDGDINRPGMNVVLLGRGGAINLARYGVALSLGRLARLGDVRVVPARSVDILAPHGLSVQADGDPIAVTPTRIRVADRSLNLLWPITPRR